VQYRKDGSLPAFYALNESGFDRNLPTAVLSQGVEIIREFVDAKGNQLTRVKVGEEFFIRIRLRSTSADFVPQVAVVDLLPGGVESVLELQPPADTSQGVDPATVRGQDRRFWSTADWSYRISPTGLLITSMCEMTGWCSMALSAEMWAPLFIAFARRTPACFRLRRHLRKECMTARSRV
jgi:hypothetical protein